MHKKNGKERGLESLTDQKYYLVDVMLLSFRYSTVDFCIDSFISSSPELDFLEFYSGLIYVWVGISDFSVRVDFLVDFMQNYSILHKSE